MSFRVSIVEPNSHGHHYSYVRHLIVAAIRAGADTSLFITRQGSESQEFNFFIEDLQAEISVYSQLATPRRGRFTTYRDTVEAIKASAATNTPDLLIYPTADFSCVGTGLMRFIGNNPLRKIPHSECMLTKIGFAYKNSQSVIVDYLERIGMMSSPWERIGVIDVIAYESARIHLPRLADRLKIYPDPIFANVNVSTKERARVEFGIPNDKHLFVCPGIIRIGKGISQLLEAFMRLPRNTDACLLLAGPVRPEVHQLLSNPRILSEINAGRIRVVDRVLSEEELGAALIAGDVTCCSYPAQNHPSSIAVKSLAYGRPVVYSDTYWLGAMGRRFDMGWQGNPADPDDLASAMLKSVWEVQDWRLSAAAEMLVRFQSVSNFEQSWMDTIHSYRYGKPFSDAISWDNVEVCLNQTFDSSKIRQPASVGL